MSIAYLLQLLWHFEISYRNPMSAIFKMAAVPANFHFQIENVLHDIYYSYAKCHAFTTFCTIFSRIALTNITTWGQGKAHTLTCFQRETVVYRPSYFVHQYNNYFNWLGYYSYLSYMEYFSSELKKKKEQHTCLANSNWTKINTNNIQV